MSTPTTPRVGDRVRINCSESYTHNALGTVTQDDTALTGGGVTVRLDAGEHRTYHVSEVVVVPATEYFSENVAVRTITLYELGRYLIDLSGEEKVVSDGYQVEELPRTLVAELVEWLRLDLGCDHSVGICYCREAELVEALILAFEGKIVCPACLGDGYRWDQAAWDKANAYCEKMFGMTASDGDGMVPCTTCHCSGKIIASTPAGKDQR